MTIFLCIGLSACGKGFESLRDFSTDSRAGDNGQVNGDGNSGTDPQFLTSEEAFAQSLHPLVKFRCGSCHTTQVPQFATVDVPSAHNNVMQAGLINFANAASSDIVREIAGGHQGIDTNVAAELEQAILVWKDQSGQ